MSREPRWDEDKSRGEEAENLFRMLRCGILAGSTEVKRDDEAFNTGNVYIELECRRNGEWHPSGLNDPDLKATAWCIVFWPVVLAIPTWILRMAIVGASPRECKRGSHPTKGVVVPLGELLPRLVNAAKHGRKEGRDA